MQIPLTLVWFGVLGLQNKALNLRVALKLSWNVKVNEISDNFFNKRNLALE